MTTVFVYTDGACKGNPGPGGWGALLKYGAHEKEIFGGEEMTTNNRMELQAVIEALRAIRPDTDIVITTDSSYVKNGITNWIDGWKARGWKTSTKQPVKNADLWRELDHLCNNVHRRVKWEWVKGHSGHLENERADTLANKGVEDVLRGVL